MESMDLSALIGRRITEKRAALGLTLDALAARTKVSRAMISRIERGEAHASAVVLDKLSSGLGISLSALFARDTAVASPLARLAEQPVWRDPASGYLRREVSPPGTGSPVQIVAVDFPAGAEVAFDRLERATIDQHVWMLAGEMEIETEGVTHRLAAGDCLHMTSLRNTFRNRTALPARYAVILVLEPKR